MKVNINKHLILDLDEKDQKELLVCIRERYYSNGVWNFGNNLFMKELHGVLVKYADES